MEEIFYAVLALHTAGKPINKENIQAVLRKAGTQVDEPALDAMAAFVESLATVRQGKERAIDPRIIKFLTSELTGQKVETKQLEVLLAKLSQASALVPETQDDLFRGRATLVEGEAKVVAGGLQPNPKVSAQAEGRYIYGVVAWDKEVSLGPIGIEGSEVYTIPYEGLSAIVHDCSTEPYQSADEEIVKNWVRSHQGVLDAANAQLGIVIPMGFDSILRPKDAASPDQVVREWLKEDYERLHTVMKKIEGKDEYGVQVSYDSSVITKQVSEQSEELE